MSYFFPHHSIERKRQETIKLFENHAQAMEETQKRIGLKAVKNIPLFNQILVVNQKEGHKLTELAFDTWRNVYVQHGWTEIESNTRYVTRKTNIKTTSDVEELIQGKKKEIKGEQEYVEGSENWTEFEKTIKGKTYRNTYPTDKQMAKEFYWAFWNNQHFIRRLELVKASSYDIDLLAIYEDTEIFIHEAFLIMLGVAPDPDKFKRSEFSLWVSATPFFEIQFLKDAQEINKDWFKKDYTEFDEWQILLRRFFKDKKLEDRRSLELEINTKDFIKWAIDQEYIEEDTSHFRDGREAPFEVPFTEILHKQLMAKKLIKQGKHHHTWVWASKNNAYNYLLRSLFLNEIPKQYWIDEPLNENSKKNNVRWEPWQHYFGKDISRPENHTTEPSNSATIDLIVERLIEHDKGNINDIKYPDCTYKK